MTAIMMTLLGFYLAHTPKRAQNKDFVAAIRFLANQRVGCESSGMPYEDVRRDMDLILAGKNPDRCAAPIAY